MAVAGITKAVLLALDTVAITSARGGPDLVAALRELS